MKVAPTADYTVRVLRQEWEEPDATAPMYRGIFAVGLQQLVDISFVPDVSGLAPPWDYRLLPDNLDTIETPEMARLATALLSSYVVTPNDARSGTEERFTWPSTDGPDTSGVVFYVTAEEFARYAADLDRLTAVAGSLYSDRQVSTLLDHEVIGFLERRVVASSRLEPRHAILLGRAPVTG